MRRIFVSILYEAWVTVGICLFAWHEQFLIANQLPVVESHYPGNTAEVRADKNAPPYFNQHNRTDVSLIFRIPVSPAGILQLRYGHHHPIYLPCVGYTSGPGFRDRSVSLETPCDISWCSCGHRLWREEIAKCSSCSLF